MRRIIHRSQVLAASVRRRCITLHADLYAGTAGQGLVEYGLVLVLIMVVCVGVISLLGNTISQVWYEKLITGFPN